MSKNDEDANKSTKYKIPPKEMIVTRNKSALLRKQATPETSPTKDDCKKAVTPPKNKHRKKYKTKKQKNKTSEQSNNKEYYPEKEKRRSPNKKIVLKPTHELKTVLTLDHFNRRKGVTPKKRVPDTSIEDISMTDLSKIEDSPIELSSEADCLEDEEDVELSMADLIRIKEATEELTDEDLMEILTCPSPVWWEDPPDETYIEEPINVFRRGRDDNRTSNSKRQASNCKSNKSNSLLISSRKSLTKDMKPVKPNSEHVQKESTLTRNNNKPKKEELNIEIDIGNCNVEYKETFLKKRSALENILGNLKKNSIVDSKKTENKKRKFETKNVSRTIHKGKKHKKNLKAKEKLPEMTFEVLNDLVNLNIPTAKTSDAGKSKDENINELVIVDDDDNKTVKEKKIIPNNALGIDLHNVNTNTNIDASTSVTKDGKKDNKNVDEKKKKTKKPTILIKKNSISRLNPANLMIPNLAVLQKTNTLPQYLPLLEKCAKHNNDIRQPLAIDLADKLYEGNTNNKRSKIVITRTKPDSGLILTNETEKTIENEKNKSKPSIKTIRIIKKSNTGENVTVISEDEVIQTSFEENSKSLIGKERTDLSKLPQNSKNNTSDTKNSKIKSNQKIKEAYVKFLKQTNVGNISNDNLQLKTSEQFSEIRNKSEHDKQIMKCHTSQSNDSTKANSEIAADVEAESTKLAEGHKADTKLKFVPKYVDVIKNNRVQLDASKKALTSLNPISVNPVQIAVDKKSKVENSSETTDDFETMYTEFVENLKNEQYVKKSSNIKNVKSERELKKNIQKHTNITPADDVIISDDMAVMILKSSDTENVKNIDSKISVDILSTNTLQKWKATDEILNNIDPVENIIETHSLQNSMISAEEVIVLEEMADTIIIPSDTENVKNNENNISVDIPATNNSSRKRKARDYNLKSIESVENDIQIHSPQNGMSSAEKVITLGEMANTIVIPSDTEYVNKNKNVFNVGIKEMNNTDQIRKASNEILETIDTVENIIQILSPQNGMTLAEEEIVLENIGDTIIIPSNTENVNNNKNTFNIGIKAINNASRKRKATNDNLESIESVENYIQTHSPQNGTSSAEEEITLEEMADIIIQSDIENVNNNKNIFNVGIETINNTSRIQKLTDDILENIDSVENIIQTHSPQNGMTSAEEEIVLKDMDHTIIIPSDTGKVNNNENIFEIGMKTINDAPQNCMSSTEEEITLKEMADTIIIPSDTEYVSKNDNIFNTGIKASSKTTRKPKATSEILADIDSDEKIEVYTEVCHSGIETNDRDKHSNIDYENNAKMTEIYKFLSEYAKGSVSKHIIHICKTCNSTSTKSKVISKKNTVRYCFKCSSIFETENCDYCLQGPLLADKAEKFRNPYSCQHCVYLCCCSANLKKHLQQHSKEENDAHNET